MTLYSFIINVDYNKFYKLEVKVVTKNTYFSPADFDSTRSMDQHDYICRAEYEPTQLDMWNGGVLLIDTILYISRAGESLESYLIQNYNYVFKK